MKCDPLHITLDTDFVMPSVANKTFTLSVVMPKVVMLSGVAPYFQPSLMFTAMTEATSI